MLTKLYVLVLMCITIKEAVVSELNVCEIEISRLTKDKEETEFFKHVENYLLKHRTVETLSAFLSNGELSLELRLLIDLDNKTVTLNPKFVKLSVRNRNNFWPEFPRNYKLNKY